MVDVVPSHAASYMSPQYVQMRTASGRIYRMPVVGGAAPGDRLRARSAAGAQGDAHKRSAPLAPRGPQEASPADATMCERETPIAAVRASALQAHAQAATRPSSDAQTRARIRPGARVAVVQKEHQPTGELTTGVVSQILTGSAHHPRGVKVRLVSGLVGRVQRVLPGGQD
ncbi:hypothetical protein KFE25_012917 [Diacronema lutheri]|uniref:YwbE family protein n=1 Tax=Diacronema lutheri TaxID=2081491 RepID=A0A8J5XDN3_DIALT|nr:hypothetical protein KFE25_012917 [Diacronema lutheri]